MKKKIIVTSALLYANGPLHLGHLVEYIQTDIYVRFLRLIGEDAKYFCADDTHGTPIEINAAKQGISPAELISKVYEEHIRDFKLFNISFDNYYTTNSEENKAYSDRMFRIAKDRGFIYKKEVNQLYCNNCSRFLPDRYIKGTCPKCGAEEQYGDVCEKCGSTHKPTELESPHCAVCASTPEEKSSLHYFFRLSAFSKRLDGWLEQANLQKEIVNSVSQWIREGLQDWDISRDGPYFGFKIPEEDNLYYYVWWDAPIGYMASADNYCRKNKLGSAEENYWLNENAKIIHFIGKDIIYFHFLFWPAVLMACDYKTPDDIVVHGFLTVQGEKMSKSRGTFITASDFARINDPEHLRYFYARMLSKKLSDVDFSHEEFESKVNNELVANIANFCYRVISFSNKHFDGKITKFADEKDIVDEIRKRMDALHDAYMDVNLKAATGEILTISTIGNKYFQDNAPWKLVKENKDKVEEILGLCLGIAKNLAIAIKPVMPVLAASLEKQLNMDVGWADAGFQEVPFNLNNEEMLAQKIEAEKKQYMPFNLKVGQILKAEAHPDADKLLVLQVDLGSEKRQIVAGLKAYYSPDELGGKRIVVVENLEYAKLRGKESQGMLLAADDGTHVKLISPLKSVPGDRVYLEGHDNMIGKISFKEFMNTLMQTSSGKVMIDGKELKTEKEMIITDMPDGSRVR